MNKEIEIPEGYEARIEGNKVIFEPKESEDERIRKAISYAICAAVHEDGTLINDVTKDEALAYLEKYKVGCIYPEDNPLTPDECIKPTELCEEHKYIRTLKSLIVDFLRGKDEVDRMYYDKIYDWLERQKEQKPNIGLIQCSWYMEGYHDGKYNNEPKWLIQTGEGGPRYEENPKYGTQKPALRLVGDGLISDPNAHFELESEQKPAEWNEEDEKHLNWVIENFSQGGGLYDDLIYWLTQLPKRFRHQPHWKPSEEQMEALSDAYVEASTFKIGDILESLYNDLKKL